MRWNPASDWARRSWSRASRRKRASQPKERHDPPPRQQHEAALGCIQGDHLQGDALRRRRLLGPVAGVALVDIRQVDTVAGRVLRRRRQRGDLGAVLVVGGGDVRHQELAQGVDRAVDRAAFAPFRPVVPRPPAAAGGADPPPGRRRPPPRASAASAGRRPATAAAPRGHPAVAAATMPPPVPASARRYTPRVAGTSAVGTLHPAASDMTRRTPTPRPPRRSDTVCAPCATRHTTAISCVAYTTVTARCLTPSSTTVVVTRSY